MKRSFVVLVVLLGATPCWPGKPLSAAEPAPYAWKAGVASAKITPQEPMWMAGYAARKKPSEGTAQDLFAKSLALEDEAGGRLVIITLDLIGVLPSLREAVEKQVHEKYGLPPERLLLNASHTHCGPEYRERKDHEEEARKYHQFLEETLVKLAGEALDKLAPAQVAYSHARAGFAMNRRLKTEKGYRNSPNPDGPVDHDVPVLRVADSEGALRAVLFGYACHNTTLGFYEFCGDYAGYAQEYLEADHPGATALFVMGCGADQNPYPRSELVLAQRHGRTLATAVEAALFATPRPVSGPIRCALETIELQRTGDNPGTQAYPIQVIRFGSDLTLVALASEVVVDYSLRLKRELTGGPAVWIAGYSNGYFGYIPSKRVLEEGGYEAAALAPSTEEQIVAKVHELNGRLEAAETP
jgi:neutral ceramidase